MKYKVYFLAVLFSMTFYITNAQQLSVLWATRLGYKGWDFVNAMVKDSLGGCIVGGSLNGIFPGDTSDVGLAYSNNAYLTACDATGRVVWQNVFGGTQFDNITSIATTTYGTLVSGIFQDTLYYGQNRINTCAFTSAYLVMVDIKGNPIWLKQVGGPAIIRQIDVCSDNSKNLYMAGVFSDSIILAGKSYSHKGETGFFLTKLNSDGTENDPLTFNGTGICSLGRLRNLGDLICLSGSFSDTLRIGDTTLVSIGGEDAFIALFDAKRKLKQLTMFEGLGTEQIKDLIMLPGGEIFLAGNYEKSILVNGQILQSVGGKDIFVADIDSTGNLAWIRSIGGHGNDYSYAVATGTDDNYYISGNFTHNIQIPDANGNLVDLDASSPFGNAFIAKFSHKGELKASFNIPASSEDYGQSIIINVDGTITVSGNFYQTLQLDSLGNNVRNIDSQGERDIFVLRFKDLCEGINVDAGNDTVLCPGQTLTLYLPKEFPFAQWVPGGTPNQSLEVTKPGNYRLLVTDRNGCIASDSIQIKEFLLPKVFAGNDTIIDAGEIIQLENALTVDADENRWRTSGSGSYGNEYSLRSWYSPSYEDISNGILTLTLEASNRCQVANDDFVLTIKQDDDGITPFPNPTQDEVTLVCTKGISIQTISITTQSGVIIMPPTKVNSIVWRYNLSSYPPGTFLFHVNTGSSIVTKVINKH